MKLILLIPLVLLIFAISTLAVSQEADLQTWNLVARQNTTHAFNGVELSEGLDCWDANWTNTTCRFVPATNLGYAPSGYFINHTGNDAYVYNYFFNDLVYNNSWRVELDAYFGYIGRYYLLMNNATASTSQSLPSISILWNTGSSQSARYFRISNETVYTWNANDDDLNANFTGLANDTWHKFVYEHVYNASGLQRYVMYADGNIIYDVPAVNFSLGFQDLIPTGLALASGGWGASKSISIGNVSVYVGDPAPPSAVVDTTFPYFINSTAADNLTVTVDFSDDTDLYAGYLESNVSGSVANTSVPLSGLSQEVVYNNSESLGFDALYYFRIYAEDAAGNINASDMMFYQTATAPLATPPVVSAGYTAVYSDEDIQEGVIDFAFGFGLAWLGIAGLFGMVIVFTYFMRKTKIGKKL